MIAGYWLPQACSNSANAAPRPQRWGGVDLAQVLADLLQYFDAYRSEARARCTDETPAVNPGCGGGAMVSAVCGRGGGARGRAWP